VKKAVLQPHIDVGWPHDLDPTLEERGRVVACPNRVGGQERDPRLGPQGDHLVEDLPHARVTRSSIVVRHPVVDHKDAVQGECVAQREAAVGEPTEILRKRTVLERGSMPFAERRTILLEGLLRVIDAQCFLGPRHAGRRLVPDGPAVFGDAQAEVHQGRGKSRESLVDPSGAQIGIVLEQQRRRRAIYTSGEPNSRLVGRDPGSYRVTGAIAGDHGAGLHDSAVLPDDARRGADDLASTGRRVDCLEEGLEPTRLSSYTRIDET
jgi:hypothetical protein